MSGRRYWKQVTVYSAAHFLVDFACAFLMFRGIRQSMDWYACILLYNFCAFAMQMPLGILADRWNRNALFAAMGCLVVAGGYGLVGIPLAAALLAGIGNGMFHVGGGVDVLNISEEKSGALGVFVSPGAFGIYFGTILGRGGDLATLPIVVLLLLGAGGILAMRYLPPSNPFPANASFSLSANRSPGIWAAALCLFLVVCLRSYVGLALNVPWKGVGCWGTILTCAVVLGKTAGGFLADGLGARRATVLSLSLAAILFLASGIPLAGVLAVLLFNMTMPITLWAVAKLFPGAKGFAFGLLTFGLFVGFLPAYYQLVPPVFLPWLFGAAAAISLATLWAGLRKARV